MVGVVASVMLVSTAANPQATEPSPSASSDSLKVFPEDPLRELVVRTCAACHPPEQVVAKRHTPEEWDDIIARMIDRGAVATDEEQQQILGYLVRFFGPQSSNK